MHEDLKTCLDESRLDEAVPRDLMSKDWILRRNTLGIEHIQRKQNGRHAHEQTLNKYVASHDGIHVTKTGAEYGTFFVKPSGLVEAADITCASARITYYY